MGPITLPEQIMKAAATLTLTPGTYTDLVNETWAGQDVDTDSVLASADTASSLLTQAGTTLPSGSDTITALGNLGGTIPAQGASTFSSDMATAQAGMDAKAAAISDAVSTIPPVLELPINPAGNAGVTAPPTQTSTALGNVSISGGGLKLLLGHGEMTYTGIPQNMQNVYVFDSVNANAYVEQDERDDSEGDAFYTYYLILKPLALGPGTVQVNWNQNISAALVIATYSFTGVA